MRSATILALACMAALLACQPSADVVAQRANVILQQQIASTFAADDGAVKLNSITAVRQLGNQYQGVADFAAYGQGVTLKVSILADREHTICEISHDGMKALGTFVARARLHDIAAALDKSGEPPVLGDVAVTNAVVFAAFPPSLRSNKIEFSERFRTTSPVKVVGSWWFGSGCKPHECDANAAGWAIERDTGNAYAIIVHDSGRSKFELYGASRIEDIPLPLLRWAFDYNISPDNYIAR